MQKSSIELGVGIFVLIGILCVGYLTIRLGEMEFFEDDRHARPQTGEMLQGFASS